MLKVSQELFSGIQIAAEWFICIEGTSSQHTEKGRSVEHFSYNSRFLS